MFDLRKSIKIGLIPIIGLTILEAIWNIIGRIYILYLISPILYIVKFSIYGYCGYLAYTRHNSNIIEGATAGAVAGFIFAFIEGLIISTLFTGTLFYHWGSGLPISAGISTIITQVLYGIIFSAIGVYITPRYLKDILRSRRKQREDRPMVEKTVNDQPTSTESDTYHSDESEDVSEYEIQLEWEHKLRMQQLNGLYGKGFSEELAKYLENKKDIRLLQNYVFNYDAWSQAERDYHGEVFNVSFRESLDDSLNKGILNDWLKQATNYYLEKAYLEVGLPELTEEDIIAAREAPKEDSLVEYVKGKVSKLLDSFRGIEKEAKRTE